MSKQKPVVYAFIDSQNVNPAIREQGWKLDFARFRVYLKDKYKVDKAYIFIGFMPSNQGLYSYLQNTGFHCVFRPTLTYRDGTTKGNCDGELILQAMIDFDIYDQAVIVSGDGDFYCLINHLIASNKLKTLLVPNRLKYSALLKLKEFKPFTSSMNDLRHKLEQRDKKKNPRKDKTLRGKSSIGDVISIAKISQKVNRGNKQQRQQQKEEQF